MPQELVSGIFFSLSPNAGEGEREGERGGAEAGACGDEDLHMSVNAEKMFTQHNCHCA